MTALQTLVAAQLPEWLPHQRWFGDKGRAITRVELIDALNGAVAAERFSLSVVRVHFDVGEPALYFVPLTVAVEEPTRLVDATSDPQFGRWFLGLVLDQNATQVSTWHFAAGNDAALLDRALQSKATAMGAEQSNTSLRYDDVLIAKLIRRLQPAPNPDEEVLKALSTTSFTRAPAFLGASSWRSPTGVDYPFALLQAFVPNLGDGWSWMLARLGRMAEGQDTVNTMHPERLLGVRTGELHLALAGVKSVDFSPEAIEAPFVATQIAATELASRHAASLLLDRQESLSPATRNVLPTIVKALENPERHVEGFRAEEAGFCARVHGDYHLGQTLRTLDDDWEIIDFEGEPARPVSERRRKVSVLKDVAGMLRSFAYARGAAERHALSAEALGRLAVWERDARQSFVTGYREALRGADSPLVPEGAVDFARATAAWEFDKAVYEIAYEARNRPDWLDIPLRSLFPELYAPASDATGAAPA